MNFQERDAVSTGLDPVWATVGNVNDLPLKNIPVYTTGMHPTAALQNEPVLVVILVILHRDHLIRMNVQHLDLAAGDLVDRDVETPRTLLNLTPEAQVIVVLDKY